MGSAIRLEGDWVQTFGELEPNPPYYSEPDVEIPACLRNFLHLRLVREKRFLLTV